MSTKIAGGYSREALRGAPVGTKGITTTNRNREESKLKLILIRALYDAKAGKYVDVELNGVDEICEHYRWRMSDYDEIYDYFRKSKFGSNEEIADKLRASRGIGINSEDVDEFLNLPFEKIYLCPECDGSLEIISPKNIMRCTLCNETFSPDNDHICPLCKHNLKYNKDAEKLECVSCKEAFSPQRFAEPKDNWLTNEVGKGWEKVTPDGYHHNAPPLPDVGIYPNPYR